MFVSTVAASVSDSVLCLTLWPRRGMSSCRYGRFVPIPETAALPEKVQRPLPDVESVRVTSK